MTNQRPRPGPGIAARGAAAARNRPKSALALLVGTVAAAGLLSGVPLWESGRKVDTVIDGDEVRTINRGGNLHLKAYLDPVRIVTICDGDTHNVRLGMVETPEGCQRRLEAQILAHIRPVLACAPAMRGHPGMIVAAGSYAYNAGPRAVCRSPIVARLNAGDLRGACEAFGPYFMGRDSRGQLVRMHSIITARGRVLPGLVRRRAWERETCLRGIQP
jgi:lysozyme